MKYFYDRRTGRIAHIWDGENTFCGFLNDNEAGSREIQNNKASRELCHSCEVRWIQWNKGG